MRTNKLETHPRKVRESCLVVFKRKSKTRLKSQNSRYLPLGAASTGDNLFTEDVEDVVASAKEDAASQLHVSDDKLKALDLFIGTEDDDGSAAKPSKSGSIDKTFGGLSFRHSG